MKAYLILFMICFFARHDRQTSFHQLPDARKEFKYIDTIPNWVKKIYEKDTDRFLNDAIPIVVFFRKLSDSSSYCLYKVEDGVCLMTFVATQKNKKHSKEFEVGSECDADFSNPEYSYTNYKHDSINHIFRSTTKTEKAKSKYLTKEGNFMRFKEGFDLENAETIKTTKTSIITIYRNGNITVRNN